METLADLGEFGLIRHLAGMLKKPPAAVRTGIGDDCAVIRQAGGRYLLWTVDILLEGRHFTADAPPRAVGRKALAVSLSDVAAMGGKPRQALVFAGIPPATPPGTVLELYRGVAALADRFRVAVIGGDTSASEKMVIGTTVLGEVERKYLTLRSGARPGDLVCVTGRLGRGAERHLSFTPRVREGRRLVRTLRPSAMIDISDGLLGDFSRIAEQSGTGGRLWLEKLPCAPGVKPEEALASGEEFELLFTVAPGREKAVADCGCALIGEVTGPENGVTVLDGAGRAFREPAGYDHFRRA